MKSILTKILILLALLISNTFALEVTKLPLRGVADYGFFFFSIYEAKLWTEKAENIYEGRVGLLLTYKRDFTSEQIVQQTIKELVKAGIDEEKAEKWSDSLRSIFPNITSGDSLMADFKPEEGITFYYNQEKNVGSVTNLDFAKAFLNIWLGPKTSAPGEREQLLGGRG